MTFMQAWNIIVKKRLGLPYNYLEINYQDFVKIIQEKTLRYVSQWLPRRVYFTIDTEKQRVQGLQGTYIIPYPDEIVSIAEVRPTNSDLMFGMPLSVMNSTIEQATDTVSKMLQAVPSMNTSILGSLTWEFQPPNKLKLIPANYSSRYLLLVLEVVHRDFDTIPGTFKHDVIELALADVFATIADIRSKYQQINSPFGDISLNPDTYRTQSENIMSKIYERLSSLPPNLIVTT